MVVQSNILASSAARMAAKPIHVQMSYLERAHQHCTAVGGDTTESTQRLQAEILSQMGTLQKAAGNAPAAIRYFQTTLETKPGDGHALAQLASLGVLPESSAVQHLEADYIRDLFDGYANRFEEELVTILDYKGHVWVAEEAGEALTSMTNVIATSGKFTIVDIGCGTGLVGDYLVQTLKLPSRLLGVDLSERMVKLAAARTRTNTGDKIYESVYRAEALEYLNQLPPGSIHGIVAADVFIYIGNLESIFQSSRRALVDSGVVVFSVELSLEEQGMVLLSSGRFGHSKEYIKVEARKAGFHVKVWKEGELRKQRGQNVRGAVVVLEKANGDST